MIVYGKSEDETVELTSKALGMSEIDVRFMLAVGRGEKTGDIVKVHLGPRVRHPRKPDKHSAPRRRNRPVPA